MNCPHCGQVGCVGGVSPGECDKMLFREHLKASAEDVKKWPRWKQSILGGTPEFNAAQFDADLAESDE